MLYFSPGSSGFYDDAIHASVPSDAVPITAERHRQMMDAQSDGLIIGAGEGGGPVAIERPAPTSEQAMAELRKQRNRLLVASDFSQFPDAPLSEDDRAAWRIYRQDLRDLPQHVTDPLAVEWPAAPSN